MINSKLNKIDDIKNEIDQYRPLKQNILKELKEYFRIGLTYSSNALEGNSLTETETKIVLEEGITIGGKLLKDHFEAVGHSEAYDLLYTLKNNNSIEEKDILNLHKIFYFRIDANNAGQYRKENVFITGTKYVPPSAKQVTNLMQEFITNIPKLKQTLHPVEFAATIHRDLVSIHPFIDGNGRTARLLMNLILLQSGYVITIIPPILRTEYIATLKKTNENPKDNNPFISFIASMVHESLKDYLRMIIATQ